MCPLNIDSLVDFIKCSFNVFILKKKVIWTHFKLPLFPGLYFLEKLFKFHLTKHYTAIINRLGTLNFIAVDNNMVAIFLIVVGHDHYQWIGPFVGPSGTPRWDPVYNIKPWCIIEIHEVAYCAALRVHHKRYKIEHSRSTKNKALPFKKGHFQIWSLYDIILYEHLLQGGHSETPTVGEKVNLNNRKAEFVWNGNYIWDLITIKWHYYHYQDTKDCYYD